jgi:hypothetical protein
VSDYFYCGLYLTSILENSRKLIFGVPIRASLSETDGPIPAAIQGCLNYIEENSMCNVRRDYYLPLYSA